MGHMAQRIMLAKPGACSPTDPMDATANMEAWGHVDLGLYRVNTISKWNAAKMAVWRFRNGVSACQSDRWLCGKFPPGKFADNFNNSEPHSLVYTTVVCLYYIRR